MQVAGAGAAHPSRQWIIAPPHPQRERLARDARISPLLAQILLNRGVNSASELRSFLAPEFRALLPPTSLPNAVEAANRLIAAVRARRKIVIYGDYDVDGVSATAILWHGLTLAGADVDYYVPSRLEEGYGLNADALERIAANGGQVVITVDCGVTAVDEARRAKGLGLELIITDHHHPTGELPDALLVHPTALGASGNPHLSGAGVALKIAWAFAQQAVGAARVNDAFREYLMDATAFAALGLVADVVPLTGENRIIASFGLRRLAHTNNPGLSALIDVSGLVARKHFDDYDVGFVLGPRLNAVGRMGHARDAVELFTRAGFDRAQDIARHLDAHNRERQSVEREVVHQAEGLVVERGFDRDACRGIVLASRAWHAGVIGIVAARLVERFGRPTVLISLDGDAGQGSGRSVRHFPLHEVLACCREHLISHGGHAMAAGVRIHAQQVEPFTRAFQAQAAQRLTPADLRPKLHLDDEVELAQVTAELAEPLERMAPFGLGNPRPKLATGTVELAGPPRVVGRQGQHLQLTVRQGATHRKAVAFGRGSQASELADHPRLRLAFEPLINEWNGARRLELKVLDWKPA